MKQWIAVALLAATSAAQAEVEHFSVRYEGFYDEQAGTFNPKLAVGGYFDVDDLNGDGTYSVDELVFFQFGSASGSGNSVGCSFEYPREACLNSFSFTPGKAPSLSASVHIYDEMYPWSESIDTGNQYTYTNFGSGYYELWTWTSSTQTYVNGVNVSPVPEPAQYGMLAAGLAAIGMLARRRRSRTD